MDLKKIMALVMVALLALPSLIMVVRADDPEDPEDGAGLAGAIERARLYLDKVRASAANLALEYEENEDVQGYLDEINELLDQNGEEDPENPLEMETHGEATAELSELISHSGTYSVHLKTTGALPSAPDWLAAEARIVIPMPEGFTLGDLETLSWWEYLVAGYPPHVDVYLDAGDELVFEYACNNDMTGSGEGHYGAETGAWFPTFNDNPSGLNQIADAAKAWANSGPAGGSDQVLFTLAEWKLGKTYTTDATYTIDSESIVTKLEIEVDNWIVQTEAYVDDIKIDGVTYDFEEELEGLGAEGFLVQASAYLAEGDIRSAARCLASARNILGRVKGLLNSMAKVHKVARTERFMRQFEHRLEGLEDKVYRLRGRLGEGINKFKASMGLAKGKLGQLDEDFPGNSVDLDELENPTDLINEGFGELDADTLEAIYRLEAKIRVLKASADRLERKGADTSGIEEELKGAEVLLEEIMGLLEEGRTNEAEDLLEDAEELVSGVSGDIRVIRKGHQNKGSNGKGKE